VLLLLPACVELSAAAACMCRELSAAAACMCVQLTLAAAAAAAFRVRVLVNPTSRDVFSYSMMLVPGNN
jgi:hypothetical protein